MLEDIVLDTNVFVYSGNRTSPEFKSSISLLRKLYTKTTQLCVDEGFSLDKNKNSSRIGYEYIQHIKPIFYAYNVLESLLRSKRIKFLPKNAPNKSKAGKFIQQKISNRGDRAFAGVTYNSSEKYLVSYDFEDFPIWLRKEIRKKGIGIRIILPSTASSKL